VTRGSFPSILFIGVAGEDVPIAQRPVAKPCLTDDILSRQHPPSAGIAAMVAIVSQDEVAVVWNLGARVAIVCAYDIRLLQPEGIALGISDINLPILYLHPFPGQSDHPFDEILAGLLSGVKYNHIAPLGIAKPIVRLNYQQALPVKEAILHTVALYLTALQCDLHGKEDADCQEEG